MMSPSTTMSARDLGQDGAEKMYRVSRSTRTSGPDSIRRPRMPLPDRGQEPVSSRRHIARYSP